MPDAYVIIALHLGKVQKNINKENEKTMARRRLITRTVKTRTVTVLGIDTETAEPMNKEIMYTPPMKDPKKELEYVKALVETDTYKIAAIVNRIDDEKTLGMEEQFFIEHAFPVTRGKTDIEEV